MKNLKVTGITLKQDSKIYLSYICIFYLNPLSPPPLFFLKHDVEYSGKRAPIEQIDYRNNILDEDEIVISGDIAKALGVTLGDKINILIRLFGKPDDDYLAMYEKKPKKFIKYFSKQDYQDKKKILRELLEHDTVNEEAISWLDKHESKLVREVGLE